MDRSDDKFLSKSENTIFFCFLLLFKGYDLKLNLVDGRKRCFRGHISALDQSKTDIILLEIYKYYLFTLYLIMPV